MGVSSRVDSGPHSLGAPLPAALEGSVEQPEAQGRYRVGADAVPVRRGSLAARLTGPWGSGFAMASSTAPVPQAPPWPRFRPRSS